MSLILFLSALFNRLRFKYIYSLATIIMSLIGFGFLFYFFLN